MKVYVVMIIEFWYDCSMKDAWIEGVYLRKEDAELKKKEEETNLKQVIIIEKEVIQ